MIEMLLRHSKDFVRTAGSAKATDTTTRPVWRHGKGTTSSACAGTDDDSAVLRVRIVMMTKSVTISFHIELRLLAGKRVHQPRVYRRTKRD